VISTKEVVAVPLLISSDQPLLPSENLGPQINLPFSAQLKKNCYEHEKKTVCSNNDNLRQKKAS